MYSVGWRARQVPNLIVGATGYLKHDQASSMPALRRRGCPRSILVGNL